MNKEKAIIGICLNNNLMFRKISHLTASHFIDPKTMKLFSYMQEIYREGGTINIVSVTEYFRGVIEVEYINELFDLCLYESSIDQFVKDVEIDKAIRDMTVLCEKIKNKDVTIKQSKAEFLEITKMRVDDKRTRDIKEIINNFYNIKDIEHYVSNIQWINERMGGWEKEGRFIPICGRPAKGKTTFMNNILLTLAMRDIAVGIISIEMSANDIYNNWLSNLASINSLKLKNKKNLDEMEKGRVDEKCEILYEKKIYINDEVTELEEIKEKIDEMVVKRGVGAIGIDYLQLIDCGIKNLKTADQIRYISKEIAYMKKKYHIPFFVCTKINRDGAAGIPSMDNIAGSDQICYDADMIIILHENECEDVNVNPTKVLYDIIIDKNKYGPSGYFRCYFRKDISRFEDHKG